MKSTPRALLLILLGTAMGIGLHSGGRWLRHFHLLPPRGGTLRTIAVKVAQPLQSAVSNCTMVVVDDSLGIVHLVSTRGDALKGLSSLEIENFPQPGYIQPLGIIPLATKRGDQPTNVAFHVDFPEGGLSTLTVAPTLVSGP